MSDTADYYTIYEGAWINWSRGRVLGSTITLNRRDGGLLISFIALFVTLVGTAFWRIICFALHQRLSSEAPRDALYHQQQAILRNSANGGSGLWSLSQVLWTWRRYKAHRPYYRMLPTIIFTMVFLGSFAVAGIFSSKIATSTGTEVLVSSQYCGLQDTLAMDADTTVKTMAPYQAQKTVDAANYAQKCYTNSSNQEDCRVYVRKQLPWTSNRNASCPFPKEMCKNEYNNIELDTGFIESNDHLGMNSPPNKRAVYRSVLQCAPLAVDKFETKVSSNDNGMEEQRVRLYLGTPLPRMDSVDYTFERWDYSSARHSGPDGLGFADDYSVRVMEALFGNGSIYPRLSDLEPIRQLRNPQADLYLFFLSSNGILFTEEINDPWYSAHQRIPINISLTGDAGGDIVDLYRADDVVSVVGCTQQVQLCNPNLPISQQCSPLGGTMDTIIRKHGLWTDAEYDVVGLPISLMAMFNPALIVQDLGVSSLTSRYTLQMGSQGPLPANQWQLEVEHWFKGGLARIQALAVEYATGPSDPALRKWAVPQNAAQRDECKNQKILTTAYTNFNTFGLCLTLALGALVIIASYSLEPLVSRVQKRRRGLDKYARLEWCANETLQLQRLAHEELGVGTWRGGADAVPVTAAGERPGMLDLADLEHPRLKAPPAALDAVLAEEAAGRRAREDEKAPRERCVGDAGSSPSSNSVSVEGGARDA